ncbi:MAG: stage III sporulation protein AA [Oscillospiraceae bacterium]|nr:stage III sporulation protein AA [Oscillospiraceae bacterium]
MSREFDEAAQIITPAIRDILLSADADIKKRVWEIRLRAGGPVILYGAGGSYFLSRGGRVCRLAKDSLLTASARDIEDTFARLCGYSVHSHEAEIRSGFLTAPGGHRAGICGTAVTENGEIKGVRSVTSINLRIARDCGFAAEELCRRLYRDRLCGVIIAGAPSTGKTTMLRDLARRLGSGSCGHVYKTAVIDERGELAALRGGVPMNDAGFYCDVFTGYPKGEAILSAIRAMSPEMIVCDEIGDVRELWAVRQGLNAGVRFAVSVHAADVRDFLRRPVSKELLRTSAFDHAVFLKNGGEPCRIEQIYGTEELMRLCEQRRL